MDRRRWLPLGALLGVLATPAQALVTYGALEDYWITSGNPSIPMIRISRSDLPEIPTCSGALLWSGMHVLTAAHCLTDSTGNNTVDSLSVIFQTADGVVGAARPGGDTYIQIHPFWNGDVTHGGDLAIITLDAPLPGTEGLDIDREGVDVSKHPFVELYGWGRGGQGATGEDPDNYPGGSRLLSGWNNYDALYNEIPGQPYMYDFDNYTPGPNYVGDVGWVHVYNFDTFIWRDENGDSYYDGDGKLVNASPGEVFIAGGDSGGPTFAQLVESPVILGIHSFTDGAEQGVATDINGITDSTFGEVGADTRVFVYADWIDSVVNTSPAPEPESWVMMLAGLGLTGWMARRRSGNRLSRDKG